DAAGGGRLSLHRDPGARDRQAGAGNADRRGRSGCGRAAGVRGNLRVRGLRTRAADRPPQAGVRADTPGRKDRLQSERADPAGVARRAPGLLEAAVKERHMGLYAELGVRPVINACATLTRLGGSLMPPEVLEAMAEAARHFVDLQELQRRVGEEIAALTRNE